LYANFRQTLTVRQTVNASENEVATTVTVVEVAEQQAIKVLPQSFWLKGVSFCRRTDRPMRQHNNSKNNIQNISNSSIIIIIIYL